MAVIDVEHYGIASICDEVLHSVVGESPREQVARIRDDSGVARVEREPERGCPRAGRDVAVSEVQPEKLGVVAGAERDPP